ncbi:protein toll-like [Mya arenaria]|uniref:protein toll-like n=1 Tax=Mya arenaria TaxID=6604 RepID=UPI0022E702CC|nr:protein toll-like [Mya arenaria]
MEEYCKIVHEDCPDRCTCFKRTYSPTIIIDCGNVNVSYLPLSFNTNFSIEMWFRNSSLKGQLDSTDYLYKVKVIDISYNAVNKITDAFFDNLIFVETTKLNNNELQTLPTNIASINATSISVSGNNFVCDCTNKWFKYWLLEDEHVVADWLEVKCTTVNGENKQIIAVPDSLFICRSEVRFSVNEHVVFPSVIIGSTLFVIVILVALTFAFRENVKVFMFLYFGIHPFDNRLDGKNRYDAALIYSVENKHTASNILKVLGEKYKVADVHMDAVVGMTIFDSMDYLILSSRRALFFISEHELLNPFTMHAWRTAYKHARDTHFDFIILIAKDQNLERSGHIPASLLRFINLRGVISVGTKLFKGHLEYKMPTHRLKNDDETHIELEHVQEDKNVLIYHERDDPYEQLADQEIIPNLNEKGILVKWLICEFQFGTDIRYEIFEIFSRTDRLIFILSRRTLLDSESMFILSSAITQSRLQKGIFLLLYVVEEIDENSRLVNGDLLEFLRQNIYLTHEERHPVEKLYEAIRFEQEIDVNRDDSENSVGDGEHEDMIGNAD